MRELSPTDLGGSEFGLRAQGNLHPELVSLVPQRGVEFIKLAMTNL